MDVRGRVANALEYVEKIARLGHKVVPDIESYGQKPFYEHELVGLPGIASSGELGGIRSWLVVARLRKQLAPAPQGETADWVELDRDSLKEPTIRETRMVTMSVADAEILVDGDGADADDVLVNLKDARLRDVTLRIAKHPDIRAGCERYIANQWKPWQAEEAKRRRTIQIYDALFNVHKQAQQEGVEFPLEAVFCLGLARQRIGTIRVNTPVVEQLVEFEIGPDAALHIRPRDIDPIVLLEPYANNDMAQVELVTQAARKLFDDNLRHDREVHPTETESYGPILSAAAVHLARDGRYLGADRGDPGDRSIPNISEELVVTDTWAIVVRRRSDNFLIQDIQRLREAAQAADESQLPEPVKRIVEKPEFREVPEDELNFRKALGGRRGLGGGTGNGSSASDGRPATHGSQSSDAVAGSPSAELYFPLPFNDQQVEIIKRLEQGANGLIVQGPPGTGKSHTIANIICHFLAMGRRVLVTSKGARALEVVQDKLPESVRALAVSLLANDQKGLRQLEGAVGLLANRVANANPDELLREVQGDHESLVHVHEELNEVDGRIRELARDQLTPPPAVLATELKAVSNSDLALWSARNAEELGWFSDRPELTTWPLPEDVQKAGDVGRMIWRDLAAHIGEVKTSAPSPDALPSIDDVAAVHADLLAAQEIDQQVKAESDVRVTQADPERVNKAKLIRGIIAEAVSVHDDQDQPWLAHLLRQWISAGTRPNNTSPLVEILETLEQVVALRDDVIRHAVEGLDARAADDAVMQAISTGAKGKAPIGFFSSRTLKARIRAIRLNGAPPNTDGWQHIERILQTHANVRVAVARWNTASPSFGVPSITLQDHDDFIQGLALGMRSIEGVVRGYRRVQALFDAHSQVLQRDLPAIVVNVGSTHRLLTDPEHAASTLRIIDLILSREALSAAKERLATWRKTAVGFDADVAKHVREFLLSEIGNPDHDETAIRKLWADQLETLREFHRRAPMLAKLAAISDALRQLGVDRLASRLLQPPVDGAVEPFPVNWRSAWLWAVVQRYLDQLDHRDELKAASSRRVELEQRRRQLLERIVANATERTLALKIRANPLVGAALATFAAMIRRIGTGKGVRAPRNRRAAKDAMAQANLAVPCWIMPHWRVSEMLPSEIASFDLVIFDEASQSDILALPALMRGKKALIVGDDKQVSPGAEFIEEALIRQLLHTYLHDMPHKDLMLPGSSLYDLGGVMFPGSRIMLLEHFRCVEPIIGFSQRFYRMEGQPNQIVPVRIPKSSERLDPPLVDVRVVDGEKKGKLNLQEVEFIVDEVEATTKNPAFAGRSIGVVSMVGNEQAHLIAKRLIDRLGAEVYENFDIACGDSATFQGDERDIMFLSMVHSPGQATSLSGLTWEQRFNVAVSRARDRVYLVRSIDKEHVNTSGMQYALIEYFERPDGGDAEPVADRRLLCESPFERDVYDRLTELGYRVIPQVKSGAFRIDLVVEGAGDRRLAVELDGDTHHGPDRWFEDFTRQQILERVGWRFWRCFASTWYRDPKGMLGELVAELHRLSIAPHVDFSSAQALGSIVEHRTWMSAKGRQKAEDKRVEELANAALSATGTPKAATARTVPAAVVHRPPAGPSEQAAVAIADLFDGASDSELAAAVNDRLVKPGDKVAIQYGDGGRIYTITISERIHDIEKGVWKVGHPTADALLGRAEHDVIEIETPGGTKLATILAIQAAELV